MGCGVGRGFLEGGGVENLRQLTQVGDKTDL